MLWKKYMNVEIHMWFLAGISPVRLIARKRNKAFRHVQNLFIQRLLFIHPRFVFIVQGSLLVVQ